MSKKTEKKLKWERKEGREERRKKVSERLQKKER